ELDLAPDQAGQPPLERPREQAVHRLERTETVLRDPARTAEIVDLDVRARPVDPADPRGFARDIEEPIDLVLRERFRCHGPTEPRRAGDRPAARSDGPGSTRPSSGSHPATPRADPRRSAPEPSSGRGD